MYSKKKNLAIVYGICCNTRERGCAGEQVGANTYLAGPEGYDRAERIPCLRLEFAHLSERSHHRNGERTRRARLDLDLGHLQRAERDVREELGRCRTRQPDRALVLCRRLLARHVHVHVLEHLVQSVLEHALQRIPEERRPNAFPQTLAALLSRNRLDTGHETLVLSGAHLRQTHKRWSTTASIKEPAHTCMLHFVTSRGVMPA